MESPRKPKNKHACVCVCVCVCVCHSLWTWSPWQSWHPLLLAFSPLNPWSSLAAWHSHTFISSVSTRSVSRSEVLSVSVTEWDQLTVTVVPSVWPVREQIRASETQLLQSTLNAVMWLIDWLIDWLIVRCVPEDGDDDDDDEGRSLSRPDDELLAPSTGQEHTINTNPQRHTILTKTV